MPDTQNGIDWDLLLSRIRDGKCTPFLGAGSCRDVLPLGSTVAEKWAEEYSYPLEDCYNLPRVAQFLAVKKEDSMFPKDEVLKQFFTPGTSPDFREADEPHGVLADLPLPLYLTTNYDDFMVQALSQKEYPKRYPRWGLCRWNKYLRDIPLTVLGEASDFEPTVEHPLVFHLHGHYKVPESLVLTEDDYLDFLVGVSRDQGLIPPRIQRAFTGSSLLFLGYSLYDWDFRIIYRSLVTYLEKSISRAHVSVQLVPLRKTAPEVQKMQAQNYLTNYFRELKVQVYWGTCREFAAELRDRWEKFGHGK